MIENFLSSDWQTAFVFVAFKLSFKYSDIVGQSTEKFQDRFWLVQPLQIYPENSPHKLFVYVPLGIGTIWEWESENLFAIYKLS